MGKSVETLLSNALYKSISDRRANPVDPGGDEINIASNYLVDVLDVYRNQIPFGVSAKVEGVDGLKNIKASAVNGMQYLLGTIKYPLTQVSREEFGRESAITTLRTIPSIYFFDIAQQEINVYPAPTISQGQIFFIQYMPLLEADNLNLQATIDPTIVPPFMQIFLEYEIGLHLCNDYNIPWSPQRENIRQSYYNKLVENGEYIVPRPDVPSWNREGLPVPWLTYFTKNAGGP